MGDFDILLHETDNYLLIFRVFYGGTKDFSDFKKNLMLINFLQII